MSRATAEVPMRAHAVSADQLAVEAVGLVKAYGRVRVLDGVELGVAPGSVFALLGPNGAGKTTIVRILLFRRAARRDQNLQAATQGAAGGGHDGGVAGRFPAGCHALDGPGGRGVRPVCAHDHARPGKDRRPNLRRGVPVNRPGDHQSVVHRRRLLRRPRVAGDPDGIADLAAVRTRFNEARWRSWNLVRVVTSTAAFGLLAWALVLYGQST